MTDNLNVGEEIAKRRAAEFEKLAAEGKANFCPCCGTAAVVYEKEGCDPECMFFEERKRETMTEPKQFSMIREEDESGVSGRGRVLDGIVWHNGWVSVCWRTDVNREHGFTSVGFYPNWESFIGIHIDPHPDNNTKIKWHECKETP